jgi:hypothetical protein
MDFGEYLRRLQVRTVYTDYIAKEQRISQGCGVGSYYDGRTIPEGNRLDILSGQLITSTTETSTILGSRIANCPGYVPPSPPPPPSIPSTIVADLTGVDFSSGGSFASTFTYMPTSTITVEFINNTSANMGNVGYIQFDREALPNFVTGDEFTMQNPTYIPTTTQLITYGPGNIYSRLYATESFGLTTTSKITLVTANEYSTIFFNMN